MAKVNSWLRYNVMFFAQDLLIGFSLLHKILYKNKSIKKFPSTVALKRINNYTQFVFINWQIHSYLLLEGSGSRLEVLGIFNLLEELCDLLHNILLNKTLLLQFFKPLFQDDLCFSVV